MIVNNVVHDLVQHVPSSADAPVVRGRNPGWNEIVEVSLGHHRFQAQANRRHHFIGVTCDIEVEDRFAQHTQAEPHHLRQGAIERSARGLAARRLGGGRNDSAGGGRQADSRAVDSRSARGADLR